VAPRRARSPPIILSKGEIKIRRCEKIDHQKHVFAAKSRAENYCYRRRRLSSASNAAAASLAHSTGVTATALSLGMGAYDMPQGLPLRTT